MKQGKLGVKINDLKHGCRLPLSIVPQEFILSPILFDEDDDDDDDEDDDDDDDDADDELFFVEFLTDERRIALFLVNSNQLNQLN